MKVKTEEIRTSQLQFEVVQGSEVHTIDATQLLRYAGIASVGEIAEISTSNHFPPGEYSNTGRTAQMPDSYLCKGSISYQFLLKSGQQRGLSLVLFHDTTRHRGTSEVNSWIYGWPVRIATPDCTKDISCHSLRDDMPINITAAKGTKIERQVYVPPH